MIEDGSVIPSFLGLSQGSGMSGTEVSLSDMRLRVGHVVAIHAPDAKSNSNGKYFEYDVEVDVGAGLSKVYPRAIIADTMGGMADFFEWTPRISEGGSGQVNKGTRVLVMCVNGHSGRAVIMGGAKHNGRVAAESNDLGHHLTFEFNGINVNISKDGDMLITHKGATASDGSVKDDNETKNGTSILMDKNGDVKIGTGKGSKNLIHLDSQKKQILLLSSGVLTGSATDSTMMGTTYRTAQQTMHTTVMPLLTALSTLIATAGGSVTAASVGLATAAVAHLAPIAGPIIGSPAIATAGVSLVAAGAALTSAGPLVAQIMAAIQTLEGQSDAFLSKKNKSD
jgi:hypothetical protein